MCQRKNFINVIGSSNGYERSAGHQSKIEDGETKSSSVSRYLHYLLKKDLDVLHVYTLVLGYIEIVLYIGSCII